MSSTGTSIKSKDKIRNTQRREIVETDIREQGPKAASFIRSKIDVKK
jgi:hypothetical protein